MVSKRVLCRITATVKAPEECSALPSLQFCEEGRGRGQAEPILRPGLLFSLLLECAGWGVPGSGPDDVSNTAMQRLLLSTRCDPRAGPGCSAGKGPPPRQAAEAGLILNAVAPCGRPQSCGEVAAFRAAQRVVSFSQHTHAHTLTHSAVHLNHPCKWEAEPPKETHSSLLTVGRRGTAERRGKEHASSGCDRQCQQGVPCF